MVKYYYKKNHPELDIKNLPISEAGLVGKM